MARLDRRLDRAIQYSRSVFHGRCFAVGVYWIARSSRAMTAKFGSTCSGLFTGNESSEAAARLPIR
jgi:hypothetical protein